MILIYVQLFVIAMIGQALHITVDYKSNQITYKKANLIFTTGQFFTDQTTSLITAFLTILVALFFVGDAIAQLPDKFYWVKGGFLFIGYFGDSIASQILGAAKKRADKAIDYKTNIADEQTGTLNSPTPALMVKDKDVPSNN